MPNSTKLLKMIKRYPFAVYSIILVTGILLITIPLLKQEENIWTVLLNLGTDFIGVTLVFFVLRLFFLEDNSSEKIEDIKGALSKQILSEMSIHTPDKIYDSSQSALKSFNYDLTIDVCNSSFYYFRGTGAKYIPVRLLYTHNSLAQIRIVMLDPRSQDAIELRARDRARNPAYANKTIAQLVAELRDEIYMTVIGLFDCGNICPIDIIYDATGTSVYRLEIFDQHTYISFYQTSESFKSTFPETVRYRKESLHHNMYKIEIQRLVSVANNIFAINKQSKETALRDHLASIKCESDDNALNDYRTRLDAFYRKTKETTNVFAL